MSELLNKVAPIELSDLKDLEHEASGKAAENIDTVSDVAIELVVRLGKNRTKIGDARKLSVGDILEVEKKAGHKVDIFLDEQHAGIGEVILVEENFGIVISEIFDLQKKRVKSHEQKTISDNPTSTGNGEE